MIYWNGSYYTVSTILVGGSKHIVFATSQTTNSSST